MAAALNKKRTLMKALVYNGPCDVQVKNMPDAKIEKPTDVLVRITTTNICGSDLHMYEGRTSMETGRILGHENMGEVIEVGNAVQRVKVGDMVCLPFNIGCGFCENCERGLSGFCLTANPGTAGAAYGFAGMGPYSGGQAELLRVPFADYNCLVLPEDAKEKENDYVMLSDILPTGYHATELAGVKPGESVVVYGAGPVGLMATMSAFIKGASQVFVVDTHKDRLALAEKMGAVAIDDTEGEGVKKILDLTDGKGADRGCECVGYQCCDKHGKEVPNRQGDRRHRRGRRVPAAGSGRAGCAGEGRQAGLRLRQLLVQGAENRHRPGQRQALQPQPGQADPRRQGQTVADHFARTGAGRGAGRLQALRQARPRLDQGRAQTRQMSGWMPAGGCRSAAGAFGTVGGGVPGRRRPAP
jgi:threonine dehydrogenase-like Zn-dependent dehydrogenase